jgi:hypothetical protein
MHIIQLPDVTAGGLALCSAALRSTGSISGKLQNIIFEEIYRNFQTLLSIVKDSDDYPITLEFLKLTQAILDIS